MLCLETRILISFLQSWKQKAEFDTTVDMIWRDALAWDPLGQKYASGHDSEVHTWCCKRF